MIPIGGVLFSKLGLVTIAAAAIWLLAMLIGVLSKERAPKKGGFRKTETFALVTTILFGVVWVFALTYSDKPAAAGGAKGAQKKTSCALVGVGDKEAAVKARLGEPDEIRGEEETRGPAANTWIYRDSRCAVHFFGDVVESIE